jgi:hypothetical protein
MTPGDNIAQANRARTEAPGGVELPTEVCTACGDRSNVASYLTWLRGCDQPTRHATPALIRAARGQGGR